MNLGIQEQISSWLHKHEIQEQSPPPCSENMKLLTSSHLLQITSGITVIEFWLRSKVRNLSNDLRSSGNSFSHILLQNLWVLRSNHAEHKSHDHIHLIAKVLIQSMLVWILLPFQPQQFFTVSLDVREFLNFTGSRAITHNEEKDYQEFFGNKLKGPRYEDPSTSTEVVANVASLTALVEVAMSQLLHSSPEPVALGLQQMHLLETRVISSTLFIVRTPNIPALHRTQPWQWNRHIH